MFSSKIKVSLVLFSLLFIIPFIQAQTPPGSISSLKEVYQDYFNANREEVFLHLNKTQVIKGEDLWFSAYVFAPHTGKPSLQTTNLHVNLYNEQGKLLEVKTVFIENGKGEGYFNLQEENYSSGKYLIKAFTHYQKNFQEELSFRQSFKILGPNAVAETEKINAEFDLQLLPEGGHLLADVFNRIGVKLIDQKGKSRPFSEAYLINSKGDTITTFKSNQFGLAKFNLYYVSDETYQLKLKPKGADWITKTLQKPEQIGLTLSVQDIAPKILHIFLSTNQPSLKIIGGEEFHIAFHQQGKIKTSSFRFPNDILVAIQTPKESLAAGVNTVTIFDENFNPLLERQFFYGENLKRINLKEKIIKVKKDSITFELQALDEHKDFNISISVLPETTTSYNPKHNIFSAFHLKPFIRGHLENGGYYFSNLDNHKTLKDLDLLLLTQGWSKYEWQNIFNGKPVELYKNERGFTIQGQLNKRPRNVNLLTVISSTGMELLELDEENKFSKNHLYIEEKSKTSFGLLKGKNNRMVKPKLSVAITPLRDTKNTKILSSDFYRLDQSIPKSMESYQLSVLSSLGELLDTVLIQSTIETKELDYRQDRLFTNQTLITKKMAERYLYITDYIRYNGFYVSRDYGTLEIKNNRVLSNSTPTVELDGMVLNPGLDPLINLRTADVEAITINKSGLGHGLRGWGGYIQIITSKTAGMDRDIEDSNMQSYDLKNGFAKNKEFYTPLYMNYNEEIFNRFGAIDWFSHLDFPQDKNKIKLKTKRGTAAGQKLFIEGMAEDGSLISEVLTIHP